MPREKSKVSDICQVTGTLKRFEKEAAGNKDSWIGYGVEVVLGHHPKTGVAITDLVFFDQKTSNVLSMLYADND